MTNEEAMKELSYIIDEMPSMECADWIEAVSMGIKALEQTRWIPISERKPNLDDFSGSRVWQKKVLITGYLSFDDTKELFISEEFAEDVILDCVLNTVIVAWMPLPKLYIPDLVMSYPQVEGITPAVVEPGYNSIKTEQELSRDIEEIKEIVNCDTDAEIKLNMITNIIYSKPHYFKALQQEPCTDAISREDALQALCKAVHKNDDTIPCRNQIVSCLWDKTKVQDYAEEILKLPSVTPVRQKVGHWISIGDFECRCSECHLWCYERNRSRYCPSCGAKMQEGE